MTRAYSERGSSEHERKVFAERLNYYIGQSGKTQAQVAKDLGFNSTTLNMWCKGKSMPTSGKVQKIADYFHIGKSELTNDNVDYTSLSMTLSKFEAMLIENYRNLDENGKRELLKRSDELIKLRHIVAYADKFQAFIKDNPQGN